MNKKESSSNESAFSYNINDCNDVYVIMKLHANGHLGDVDFAAAFAVFEV